MNYSVNCRTFRFITFLTCVLLSSSCAFAGKTIYVPNDVKTVNGAMKQAKSGDTIILKPGNYREIIMFKDGVTLKGEDQDKCRLLPVKGMPAVILARNCEK